MTTMTTRLPAGFEDLERFVPDWALETEQARLAHRVALLDPRKADPDMADELVRKDLGLARPDEVIIELP